jgi:hypothetical protein
MYTIQIEVKDSLTDEEVKSLSAKLNLPVQMIQHCMPPTTRQTIISTSTEVRKPTVIFEDDSLILLTFPWLESLQTTSLKW